MSMVDRRKNHFLSNTCIKTRCDVFLMKPNERNNLPDSIHKQSNMHLDSQAYSRENVNQIFDYINAKYQQQQQNMPYPIKERI